MKSKIAILSDIHFHNYKQHSRLVGGVNSRLLDISSAVGECFEKARDLGCGSIIIPGDVFHVRGSLKTGLLQHVMDIVNDCRCEYGMDLLIIPGNHDMEDLDGGPNAIYPLSFIPGVMCVEVGQVDFAGRRIGCVQYQPTTEKFNEKYSQLSDGADLMIIHQGIDEARPSINMPQTGISAKQFDKLVIAGHYHTPCLMNNVLSVGAPIQHNFGDEGQDRGFWTLDGNKFEFHKLTYPEFLTIDVDKIKDVDISKKIVNIKTDSEVRLDDIKHLLADAYSYSFEVQKKYVARHEEQIKISTPLEMLTQYINATGKYNGSKDGLIRVAKEILQ